MDIFVIATDDNSGHQMKVFQDLKTADNYATDWCKEHRDAATDGPMPENWEEALNIISEGDSGFLYFETCTLPSSDTAETSQPQINIQAKQI